jgi:uncharacterized protein (TIRG00374 family)
MRILRLVAGVVISAAFLLYAFRGQDYRQIWEALTGVQYLLLLPALALYVAGVAVRAYRWSVLLAPIRPISTRRLLPITAIGFMANNVLPFRTGEVVRSYVLARQHGVRKSAGLATIAVERICDGLTMLAFILVAASTVTFTSRLREVTVLALILFGLAVLGLAVITRADALRARLLGAVFKRTPDAARKRIEPLVDAFFTGLHSLRSPRAVALVAGSSLAAWLFEASMYWTIARAFGGDVQAALGVPETLLTTGIANLATLVPSSPGYVGPFEAGVVTVMSGALDVPDAHALSYAIVVHAALWFPITAWGAVEWSRHHLSLRAVRAAADESSNGDASLAGDQSRSTAGEPELVSAPMTPRPGEPVAAARRSRPV